MRAFAIDRYKPQDGGRIVDVATPVPSVGQVLVRIEAAGVNLVDAKIRSGEFKLLLPYELPLILGNDLAGVVLEVGASVRRFNVGDEVFARPRTDSIGTFAEFIAISREGQRRHREVPGSRPLLRTGARSLRPRRLRVVVGGR